MKWLVISVIFAMDKVRAKRGMTMLAAILKGFTDSRFSGACWAASAQNGNEEIDTTSILRDFPQACHPPADNPK